MGSALLCEGLTSGNVKLLDFIRFGALAMLNAFLRRWFDISLPRVRGLAGEKTPTAQLNLQPGRMGARKVQS